jgi:hypothetical protein
MALKNKVLNDSEEVLSKEYWKEIYGCAREIVLEICETNIPRVSIRKKNEDWFEKNRVYLLSLIRKKSNVYSSIVMQHQQYRIDQI